jgi:hypothetical protein
MPELVAEHGWMLPITVLALAVLLKWLWDRFGSP